MQTFVAYRPFVPTDTHNELQRNQPNEPQYQGVEFDDGVVAIRWLTAKRSVSVWDCIADALDIHGHAEYGTYIVWGDGRVENYVGNGTFVPREVSVPTTPVPQDVAA